MEYTVYEKTKFYLFTKFLSFIVKTIIVHIGLIRHYQAKML